MYISAKFRVTDEESWSELFTLNTIVWSTAFLEYDLVPAEVSL